MGYFQNKIIDDEVKRLIIHSEPFQPKRRLKKNAFEGNRHFSENYYYCAYKYIAIPKYWMQHIVNPVGSFLLKIILGAPALETGKDYLTHANTPLAQHVHCASHNLNLVINDAVSGCREVGNFF